MAASRDGRGQTEVRQGPSGARRAGSGQTARGMVRAMAVRLGTRWCPGEWRVVVIQRSPPVSHIQAAEPGRLITPREIDGTVLYGFAEGYVWDIGRSMLINDI